MADPTKNYPEQYPSQEYIKSLADLIAKRFVQRKDVKALQHGSKGAYRPVNSPWTKGDFRKHVQREVTYGHYLLDQDSRVKLFAFDVDLNDTGFWVESIDLSDPVYESLSQSQLADLYADSLVVHKSSPRSDWRDANHPARSFYERQLMCMAQMLSGGIHDLLGLRTACAYSGSKGIHVYGFLDAPEPASEVREAAKSVLAHAAGLYEDNGKFELVSSNFYRYVNEGPVGNETKKESLLYDLSNLSVEVFPKQDEIDPGHYGNLMRLPLGKNKKLPGDQTFFLDQSSGYAVFQPHPDPVWLLQNGNPWSRPEERA